MHTTAVNFNKAPIRNEESFSRPQCYDDLYINQTGSFHPYLHGYLENGEI